MMEDKEKKEREEKVKKEYGDTSRKILEIIDKTRKEEENEK